VTLAVTRDHFLGGRIVADQPRQGFRAGHDTVLLAAAVPARGGERVLELGSGAGIASLCLAWRVPGAQITGIEIDAGLVYLANENAALNGFVGRVKFFARNVFSAEIEAAPFDHVFLNPPFHWGTGQASPVASRDQAMRGDGVAGWVQRALLWARAGGTVTAILRADRLAEAEAVAGDATAISVLPLLPRVGEPAKRAILGLRKSASPSRHVLPALVLHDSDGRNTEAAEAVLRHGAALDLG
jgi:tRNA1Val (adenine37-N6)-methyltransferase